MKYRLGYDDARLSSACALRPFSELLSLCYPVACGSSSRLQKIVNSNERTVTKRRGLGRNGTRSTLPTIGYGAMCSISLRHLERHFAKHFHKTPGAWTRDLRLRLAKKLISQGCRTKRSWRSLASPIAPIFVVNLEGGAERRPRTMRRFICLARTRYAKRRSLFYNNVAFLQCFGFALHILQS
jgi:hypothetical protein